MIDRKAYRREYYLENKEEINKKNLEYRNKNREYLNMKQREYYRKNKEKWLKYRKFRYENFEKVQTCKICELKYPVKEMRGEICYLCKEGDENKSGRSPEKAKKC